MARDDRHTGLLALRSARETGGGNGQDCFIRSARGCCFSTLTGKTACRGSHVRPALRLLQRPSADDTPPSLHKLIKAYRGLRIDDFERFLTFFREAGYDLDARDAKGNDFVALVADQRQAAPYIEALQAAKGA